MNRGRLDWPAASSSGAGMIGGMRATRVARSRLRPRQISCWRSVVRGRHGGAFGLNHVRRVSSRKTRGKDHLHPFAASSGRQ